MTRWSVNFALKWINPDFENFAFSCMAYISADRANKVDVKGQYG